jgi:hypothetical protein
MNRLEEIVLVMRSRGDEGAPLETAAWMARRTGAQLALVLGSRFPGGQSAVERRLKECAFPRFAVKIQSCAGDIPGCLCSWPRSGGGVLFVLGGMDESAPGSEGPDPETVAIIEAVRGPLLLFPFRESVSLPWSLIVTPMSGEIRDNRALSRSVELANQLQVPLDIIHVVDPEYEARDGGRAVGRFGDEAHHELQAMIEEFISEACPYCSPSEKRVIRTFHLAHGDTTEELLRHVSGTPVSMLAVEWKGSFMEGHAETLKALIRHLRVPVLLVRQSETPRPSLRAGHRLAG